MRTYEHRMISESEFEVWYVDGEYQKKVNDDKPDYLQWILNGNTPAVVAYVAPEVLTQEQINAQICTRSIYTKLEIRRAMRALGNESMLDALITNTAFAKDWNDAIEINLSDALVADALALVQVDVNAVKLKIHEMTGG